MFLGNGKRQVNPPPPPPPTHKHAHLPPDPPLHIPTRCYMGIGKEEVPCAAPASSLRRFTSDVIAASACHVSPHCAAVRRRGLTARCSYMYVSPRAKLGRRGRINYAWVGWSSFYCRGRRSLGKDAIYFIPQNYHSAKPIKDPSSITKPIKDPSDTT